MRRFLLTFVVVLGLAGCNGMPTWIAGGSQPPPPMDEPDAPADDAVADPVVGDKVDVGDLLTVVAPLLPPPWGAVIPLLGSLAVLFTKKDS